MRHSDHIARLQSLLAATRHVDYRGVPIGTALKVPYQDYLRFEMDNRGALAGRVSFGLRALRTLFGRFIRGGLRGGEVPRLPGPPLRVVAISDHSGHSTQLLLDSLASFKQDEVLYLSTGMNAMRQLTESGRPVIDVRSGLLEHRLRRIPLYWRLFRAINRCADGLGLAFRLHILTSICAITDAIDFYSEFFENFGGICLLTSADGHWHEYVATQTARANGLQTFTSQHGELTDIVDYVPIASDVVFVWGERSRSQFEHHGVPTESIVLSGNPKFDRVFRDLLPRRDGLRRSFLETAGLPPDRITITYLSSGILSTLEMDYDRCGALFRCFAETSFLPANLIVKLHPHQDDIPTYQRWKSSVRGGESIRILQREGILEVLTATDIAVGYHSTTCMEALGFGIPLILLDMFEDVDLTQYLSFCSDAIRCRSTEEFQETISSLVRDPSRLEAARNGALACRERYFANSTGKPAAERICEAISSRQFIGDQRR